MPPVRAHGGGREFAFQLDGVEVRVTLPETAPEWPSNWLMLTETEADVLRLLLTRGSLTKEQVADARQESADGRLKTILSNLVAGHVLRVGASGYEVDATPDWLPVLRSRLGLPGGELTG